MSSEPSDKEPEEDKIVQLLQEMLAGQRHWQDQQAKQEKEQKGWYTTFWRDVALIGVFVVLVGALYLLDQSRRSATFASSMVTREQGLASREQVERLTELVNDLRVAVGQLNTKIDALVPQPRRAVSPLKHKTAMPRSTASISPPTIRVGGAF